MYLKVFLLSIFFVSNLFSGTINVAVAANVSYAIEDLVKEFNQSFNDTKVKIILGSSGKLTAQIKHGAPYDIFMSANMKYPNALYEDKVAITKPKVYAQGSLAYLSTKILDYSQGMNLVKNEKIDKIAIANPKTAPYGKAALEAMKNAQVYQGIKNKLVYAESASQTLSYAITAADLGFVAKSSMYSSKMKRFKKGVHWMEVDNTLYTPIEQGIVLLKKAKNNQEALNFYNFILQDKAKKIFVNFGYILP